MSYYYTNKRKAIFRNTEPSATDQSQAQDTDINVIVRRHSVTGTAPMSKTPPQFEDYSELPTNLRDIIEQSRGVQLLRRTLPQPLQELETEHLLRLTGEEIAQILKPADKPADKPQDPPK